MILQPVILAGGSGTRLWPLSREFYPKQFLPLVGELTLFQETLLRLDGLADVAKPLVVCNEEHRFLVAEQLRQLDREALDIIVEPVGRNTAPALALAALRLEDLLGSSDSDTVMLVMPADHVIGNGGKFKKAVLAGYQLAKEGRVITMGVDPVNPITGYGYIKKGRLVNGANEVTSFVEKPNKQTAEEFVESKEYFWNSGIFMMRHSLWLSLLRESRPDVLSACKKAYSTGLVDGSFFRPGASAFEGCPKDSIDCAVMEKIVAKDNINDDGSDLSNSLCMVIPLGADWEDLGSWSALWEKRNQDSGGNVIQGDVYAESTKNALLIAQHRLLATIGLEDVVVVETPDAVLVAHKTRVQDVKGIVERLKSDGRVESDQHRKVHRPWGTYEILDSGDGFQVKRLTVNPGSSLSLQSHHHRAEHWVVVSGVANVTKGEEEFVLNQNESTYVPQGVTHRLSNPGRQALVIVEVQSGAYLGEDDIIRLEDEYNRPP